ncbi:uncharacterized protein METZ01_LOCUS262641, partial [marine metagenome]
MNDRELGLSRRITRRDFVQGVAVPVGGSLVLPRWTEALGEGINADAPSTEDYPPLRTGMRG